MTAARLEAQVAKEVAAWQLWLPKWRPGTYRGRSRICKRCLGSPIAAAAGFAEGAPHQVVHALLTRMHRLIDKEVDAYTTEFLPMLKAELASAELWKSGGYDARADLPEETADLDPDLFYEEGEHPVLFTFAELEAASKPDPLLPLPPLSSAEKMQLRKEMRLADEKASQVGREICFILAEHKKEISLAMARFVEPQIEQLLTELSRTLESPPN